MSLVQIETRGSNNREQNPVSRAYKVAKTNQLELGWILLLHLQQRLKSVTFSVPTNQTPQCLSFCNPIYSFL